MGDLQLKVRGIGNADRRRIQAKLIDAVQSATGALIPTSIAHIIGSSEGPEFAGRNLRTSVAPEHGKTRPK
ncbi:MAG: hypothetical protein ACRET4_06150 [Steroidobacteraceae bacterium]